MDEIALVVAILLVTPFIILLVTLAPVVVKIIGVVFLAVFIIPAICGLLVGVVERVLKIFKGDNNEN